VYKGRAVSIENAKRSLRNIKGANIDKINRHVSWIKTVTLEPRPGETTRTIYYRYVTARTLNRLKTDGIVKLLNNVYVAS